jgi:hypothetical protein
MNSLAQQRAKEQEETGMSHTRPNGERYNTIFADNGVARGLTAENLFMTTGSIDPQVALSYWKTSSGHNTNMLGDFEYVGVSVIYIDGAYYWLQLFCNSDDPQITDNAYLVTKEDITPVTTTEATTTTTPVTTTTETTTTTTELETELETSTATSTEPATEVELPTSSETTNNFVNGVYGDMDGNGEVNVMDLLLLKKLLLGIS